MGSITVIKQHGWGNIEKEYRALGPRMIEIKGQQAEGTTLEQELRTPISNREQEAERVR